VTLLLGLWACNPSGLPREYADADVPEERLNSAEARADGHGPRRNLSRPAANFADPTWRARMNPRRAYYVIREGLRRTPMPRRAYYVIREGLRRTPMPAWKILDEDQTWDLVAYVLSVVEQGPGVAASP
jgi:hypothetical protein